MITTSANSNIRHVMQLQKKPKVRREEKLFIVEGPKMFEELPKDRIEEIYVSESFAKQPEAQRMLHRHSFDVVKDAIFADMSDTKTPQGILAVAKQYEYSLEDLCHTKRKPLFLILETIQDPGNLGTMMRAGEGAGISGIIMNRETVDIYNPKVIRSTMGSLYRVPFICTEDLPKAMKSLKRLGVKVYAAHLDGKKNYDKENYKEPTAFLIGNEANGLSDSIAKLADSYIKIPMLGKVESLNAAVAGSVLLFEAARQRR
ncbi:MAG: TrmH family RNA methyltransferase [Lachnospiraceae bacterium]